MTIASPHSTPLTTPQPLTLEAYLTYDDGTDTRYELVDGILVDMGNEAKINTLIAGFLFSVFLGLGIPSYQIGFKQKIQVTSPSISARDPDLIIHTQASAAVGDDTSEFCLKLQDLNPAIVIEIVSPGNESSDNYQRDYVQKPQEYAARGIPEYWIVDPDRAWIRIGSLTNGSYQFQQFTGEDLLASPTFLNLHLTTTKLLSAGR